MIIIAAAVPLENKQSLQKYAQNNCIHILSGRIPPKPKPPRICQIQGGLGEKGGKKKEEESKYKDRVPLEYPLFRAPCCSALLYGFIIAGYGSFVNGQCSSIHAQNRTNAKNLFCLNEYPGSKPIRDIRL